MKTWMEKYTKKNKWDKIHTIEQQDTYVQGVLTTLEQVLTVSKTKTLREPIFISTSVKPDDYSLGTYYEDKIEDFSKFKDRLYLTNQGLMEDHLIEPEQFDEGPKYVKSMITPNFESRTIDNNQTILTELIIKYELNNKPLEKLSQSLTKKVKIDTKFYAEKSCPPSNGFSNGIAQIITNQKKRKVSGIEYGLN